MNTEKHILDEDIQTFERMSDELNKYHAEKFVLICKGNFIASYDNFNNAAIAAVKKFGRGPYLIRQVGGTTSMTMPASIDYRFDYAHQGMK